MSYSGNIMADKHREEKEKEEEEEEMEEFVESELDKAISQARAWLINPHEEVSIYLKNE